MIFGVSHCLITVPELTFLNQDLPCPSWSIGFVESSLPNAGAKHPFLRDNKAPSHQIVYITRPKAVAFELIGYHHSLDFRTFHQSASTFVHQGIDCQGRWAEGYDWTNDSGEVQIFSHELEHSMRFWRSLGFQACPETETVSDGYVLKNRSLMPQWQLTIFLHKAKKPLDTPRLDDVGFRGLALLVKRMDVIMNRIVGVKQVSEPFELVVGGRRMKIVLIYGPADELVELLEIL